MPLFCFTSTCALILLAVVRSILSTKKTQVEYYHFVVLNRDGCSFALKATATALDLKSAIADSCNLSSRFDIQLFRETIVSSRTPNDKTIAEIASIIAVANDLYQIWGEGFMIPLRVQPIITSPHNMTLFDSLLYLFGGLHPNVHIFEWFRFIRKCALSESCTAHDLCARFADHFMCLEGELWTIKMSLKLTGHIDLHFLPNSVVSLLLTRSSFTEIIGLDDLAGKQLRYLDVRGNPLEIDLDLFTLSSVCAPHNPLSSLRVNVYQISWSLLGIRHDKCTRSHNYELPEEFFVTVHQAASRWFQSSTLDSMMVGRTRFTKTEEAVPYHETRTQRARNLL